jgi:hypothetical protein
VRQPKLAGALPGEPVGRTAGRTAARGAAVDRRRQAWENDCRLKTQDKGVYGVAGLAMTVPTLFPFTEVLE